MVTNVSPKVKGKIFCCLCQTVEAHIQVLKKSGKELLIERPLLRDSDDHSSSRHWIGLEGGVGGA